MGGWATSPPVPPPSTMANLTIHIPMPDGKGYVQGLERLYAIAKAKGYDMPDYYKNKPENQQVSGKKVAIGHLIADIASGKIKVA